MTTKERRCVAFQIHIFNVRDRLSLLPKAQLFSCFDSYETRTRHRGNGASTVNMKRTNKTRIENPDSASNVDKHSSGFLARALLGNLVTLQLAALSHHVFQQCQRPVYGSIPSSAVDFVVYVVYLPACFICLELHGVLKSTKLHVAIENLSVLGCLIPLLQSSLYPYSGRMGPYWGPLISYATSCFPVMLLSILSITSFVASAIINDKTRFRTVNGRLLSGLRRYKFLLQLSVPILLVALMKNATAILSKLDSISDVLSNGFGMHILLVMLWIALGRSKITCLLGGFSLICLFFSPHIPSSYNFEIANAQLLDSGYSLLARQRSSTGYISVLDNVKDGFRVMRCDHSLLGGEWINKPEGHPAKFNEPIYSIFVMLEAVRLVESQSSHTSSEVSKTEKQALVM